MREECILRSIFVLSLGKILFYGSDLIKGETANRLSISTKHWTAKWHKL